jgi:hypothetical protein
LVLLVAVLLPLSLMSTAFAKNTNTAPVGGLKAVGPIDPTIGFPTWYEDSNGLRLEPCLDQDDQFCGFLPGDFPAPGPAVFPDNFPEEFFYELVGSEVDLPGGGRAVMTMGLEGAFSFEVQDGDQIVFARTRIVIRDAPVTDTTLTFQHPFGTATVDIDDTGAGRLVEDIGVSPGVFTDAVAKGKFGPFLKWTGTDAPAGYVGDPGIEHTVTGSPTGYNKFSVALPTGEVATDLFTVQGKIATNTGVVGDAAVVRELDGEPVLDVYATSRGDKLQVIGVDGVLKTTPMLNDPASERHFARILLTGSAPDQVEVVNLGDKPIAKATVKVTAFAITRASYDGGSGTLTVTASGASGLNVTGFGPLVDGTGTWPTPTPPLTVTVTAGTAAGSPSVTFPVTLTGVEASPEALPPTNPGDPTCGPAAEPGSTIQPDGSCGNSGTGTDGTGTGTAPVATVAAPTVDILRGGSAVLDGSTSTGTGLTYAWTQTSGPAVTITNGTTSKATVAVPPALSSTVNPTAPPTRPVPTDPSLITLTVTDSTGATATTDVTVQPVQDALTVAAPRHKLGTEIRVGGTSLVGGVAGTLIPQTQVYVWDVTVATAPRLLGKAPVDTLGAWELRLRSGTLVTGRQISSVSVQSTRGGVLLNQAVASR